MSLNVNNLSGFGANKRIITSISATDIEGWWDFDEGTGSTITDKTGGTNGTANNTSWTTGGPVNLPNGLDFVPASSPYVEVGNDYDLANGTVCVWVEIDDFLPGGSGSNIVGNGNGGGEFDLFTSTGGLFRGRSRIGSDRDADNAGYSTSTLYFLAYGFESSGSTDTVELWVNGSSVDSASGTWGSITDGGFNLIFGRRTAASSNYLDGRIFQGALFNRKLTLAEVQEVYNNGLGGAYEQFDFAA